MLNIIAYVAQNKKTFREQPFSAVDSLVLAQLAYLRYEGVEGSYDDPPAPMAALAALPLTHPLYANVRAARSNHALLTAVAASKRFGSLQVCRYVTQFDVDAEKQFSAVTFLLDDGAAYVAYRGTDATVVGWKEDLNMSFMEAVPSQQSAVQYLNALAAQVDRPLYLGGHSKGGNLAVYAAAGCAPAHQERIRAVYSHDGPGFREAFFTADGYAAIQARIHKTLPQSSVIGMLLQDQENYFVVRSTKVGILQHDPFSWLVHADDFQYLRAVSRGAQFMDGAINRWVSSQSAQTRGAFINALYEIIRSTNARTIDDLSDAWVKNAAAVVGALKGMDPETRRFLLYTAFSLVTLTAQHLKETLAQALPGAQKPDAP